MMDDREPLPGTLASPCVGVCRVDRTRNECLGCRRTLDEIGGWRTMDDATRRVVLEAAAERRARIGYVPAADAGRSSGGIE